MKLPLSSVEKRSGAGDDGGGIRHGRGGEGGALGQGRGEGELRQGWHHLHAVVVRQTARHITQSAVAAHAKHLRAVTCQSKATLQSFFLCAVLSSFPFFSLISSLFIKK